MNTQVVGVDLAKNLFQVHVVDRHGTVIHKKAIRRSKFLSFFASLSPSLVGMEACSSAHFWAREISKLGHTVKLMAPQYVKPYVKTNKTDANDAEAISEAVTRPTMRFVAVKSEEQQALLLVHRERDGIVKERTSLINRIRATLGEFGVAIPSPPRRLHSWFLEGYPLVEDSLPRMLNHHVMRMKARLNQLEYDLDILEKEIDAVSK